jgi:predicted CoA-binding protein
MSDDVIAQVLNLTRRIAVVGASNKPARPSYGVMQFLIAQGYDVTPVNPGLAGGQILGRDVVATLAEAAPLEMVDLFRNSAAAPPSKSPASASIPVMAGLDPAIHAFIKHSCGTFLNY